ncbi:MAG: ATP-dependent zinc metalloprotease FtsH [Candidatus Collierbacteria bacterium GW2011_GWB1_45_35]|uniref:ATP-dependent zinc metalloprotease FtsH n=2 Tax=Candidatus Collieribacteriota TaxID=1752725 RepID=A0A0G1NRG1_9BACT|nr:MAG: ATP-dependent zinc metalloprotease FtsH [Microgenomates group bacterium GW2011_GWC1_44_23]KKT86784.1 MAG: ATP-dependent zinc metalloprotease FtsH [Candidatus Collierbacteria bacterium GW2011_GWA2_44_99]KKU00507.1 MAG: ATP-dependent zinc metalloprotease FtsH [Candidatus Collierbacteria bacterium GW2011_GWB2_45_17]KKU05607.1 MAG: ATP-dependent zinc metalloprotease FtsH [Candidatus Collierbacteria bacterium GW2011_GWB1_45_35]KKU08220.1 MAG: ATP-dependent zinc metalloprotease FtsH [Candidat
MAKQTKPQTKKFEFRFNLNLRRVLMWILILFLFLPSLIKFWLGSAGVVKEIPLSTAIAEIKAGKVESVQIRGQELILLYPKELDGKQVIGMSRKEEGASFMDQLQKAGVDEGKIKLEVVSQDLINSFWNVMSLILPIVGFGLLMFYMMKRQGGGADMFGIGKSKAKLFAKGKQNVKFSDVAGVDEAKKELEEVVDFLKNPKKYIDLGARTPKGVLLTGPAGVGKTLLARAVAGEAGVPFFSMAGSEFMEMLVGVGASRVRDLFDTAKKANPSIIFIDEIDAIGRTRGGSGGFGGHDEREQTLNQILVEMDGFTQSDNVIVLAATNRPDVLDPALVRPGRFDRRVTLDLPDIAGRKAVLEIHKKGKPFIKDLNWTKVAERTVGFSGADIENMLNEAAILAARDSQKEIEMKDIEEAAMKVKMGPEKKRLQSKLEKQMTAYHEAGHALVGHLLLGTDPIHRVSIVSRGMALGYTMSRPKTDKYQQTLSELKDEIAMMLGGRAAEKIVFNELTAGAASDIERGTILARRMVVDFGMSELGPVSLNQTIDTNAWGYGAGDSIRLSEVMQAKVDLEIKKFVDDGYKLAESVIKKNRKILDKIVDRLMKVETIEQEEFEKIVGKIKPSVDEK